MIVPAYPGDYQQDASAACQPEGIWQGLWKGVHGEPLVFNKSTCALALQDDGRRSPCFWTARLLEPGRVAGSGIIAVLLEVVAASSRRIVRSGRACAETGHNPPSPAG